MKTAVKKKNNTADRSFTNIGNEDVMGGMKKWGQETCSLAEKMDNHHVKCSLQNACLKYVLNFWLPMLNYCRLKLKTFELF